MVSVEKGKEKKSEWKEEERLKEIESKQPFPIVVQPPFPQRLAKARKEKDDRRY